MIQDALRHRRPMLVVEYRTYKNGFIYAVCPGCHRCVEREYVSYCSQCGQLLDWRRFAGLLASEAEE